VGLLCAGWNLLHSTPGFAKLDRPCSQAFRFALPPTNTVVLKVSAVCGGAHYPAQSLIAVAAVELALAALADLNWRIVGKAAAVEG
jgi:hypothetical protein